MQARVRPANRPRGECGNLLHGWLSSDMAGVRPPSCPERLGVVDVERSDRLGDADLAVETRGVAQRLRLVDPLPREVMVVAAEMPVGRGLREDRTPRSEEHTSELQSRENL